MMTAGAQQPRRDRVFGSIGRFLLPLVLAMSVTVLFSMVWQSVGDDAEFAASERDGVRYIRALVPLEIALANAGSAVVDGEAAPTEALTGPMDVVAAVDRELGEQLGSQDRWSGLRAEIQNLPTTGKSAETIAAYGTANDLLLALIERVRNSSQLILDPEADIYYLQDGAAQELPESITAAARYTDLLVSTTGKTAATLEINAAAADLRNNAQDLSDNVRLAVEGSGSENLGSALLTKLDRFNQAVDGALALLKNGRVDTTQVAQARSETRVAAADLAEAILAQIDIALEERISSLDQTRLLAAGAYAVAVLLALVPAILGLVSRRPRRSVPVVQIEREYAGVSR